jgi:hypothetical protein
MAAGTINSCGRRVIEIDGKTYPANRLAWFFMTGVWPRHEVDHIDTNKLNDVWSNLREATPAQNTANKNIYRNNTSGFKGVTLDRKSGKWRARYGNGGRVSLGRFKTKEEAIEAYKRAARTAVGDFARW